MIHGRMTQIVEDKGVGVLRLLLNDFYSKYLRYFDVENDLTLVEALEGISFMPVDKNVYLRIICFNNLINDTFSHIRETVFLYRDQLVWSGLEQEDIQVLYHFIIRFVLEGDQYAVNEFIPFVRNTNGFMTGPSSLEDPRPFAVPIIYVGDIPMYLIIYRVRAPFFSCYRYPSNNSHSSSARISPACLFLRAILRISTSLST